MVVSVQVGTQRFSIWRSEKGDIGFTAEIVLGREVFLSSGMSRTDITDFLKACRSASEHIEREISECKS